MKTLRTALAIIALALPILGSVEAAQALTAHQYMSQGHGRYVSSKKRVGGMGYRHHRYHHRHHRHGRMYRR